MRTLLAFLLMVSVANAEQVGDMDGDGLVGTTESIISLQVAAGLQQGADLGQYIPATGNALPADVLSGKTFSNSSGNNLGGELAIPRALGCLPGPEPGVFTWDPELCMADCIDSIASHFGYGPGFPENCPTICNSIENLFLMYGPPFAEMVCSVPDPT